MTKRVLVLALVLSGCAAVPTGPAPLPDFVPEVTASPATASDSIGGFTALERQALRVRVRTCTEFGTGTAFAIDETHAITNRHVAEGATDITLTGYDGRTYTAASSVVSRSADLALLTIKGEFPDIATFADTVPARGDDLTIAGYPKGQALAVTEGPLQGTVPDTLGINDDPVFQIGAESHPGNSGSPVGNAQGHVVGVLYASDDVHTSFAVTLATLQDFLDNLDDAKKNSANCT